MRQEGLWRRVRRVRPVIGLALIGLAVNGCGGSTGGVPTGIAAGVLNVHLSSNFLSAQVSGSAGSTIPIGDIQDLTGVSQSALVILKGAGPTGEDVQQFYVFPSAPSPAKTNGLQVYSGIPTGGSATVYVTPFPFGSTAAGATAWYAVDSSKPGTTPVVNGFLTANPTKYTFPPASPPQKVVGVYTYGYQQPATVLRTGTFDGIVYFFATAPAAGAAPYTEASLIPPGNQGGAGVTPILGVVLRATINPTANGAQINLTDPSTTALEYGTFRTLSISVPAIKSALTDASPTATDALIKNSWLHVIVGTPGQGAVNGASPITEYAPVQVASLTTGNGYNKPAYVNGNLQVVYLDRGQPYNLYLDLYNDSALTQVFAGNFIPNESANGVSGTVPTLTLNNEVTSITQVGTPQLLFGVSSAPLSLQFQATDSQAAAPLSTSVEPSPPYIVAPSNRNLSQFITYPSNFAGGVVTETGGTYTAAAAPSTDTTYSSTDTVSFALLGSTVTGPKATVESIPVGKTLSAPITVSGIPTQAGSVVVELTDGTNIFSTTVDTGGQNSKTVTVNYISTSSSAPLQGFANVYSGTGGQGIVVAQGQIAAGSPPTSVTCASTLTSTTVTPAYAVGTTLGNSLTGQLVNVSSTVIANFQYAYSAFAFTGSPPSLTVTTQSTSNVPIPTVGVLTYAVTQTAGPATLTLTQSGASDSFASAGNGTSEADFAITPSYSGTSLGSAAKFNVGINPTQGTGGIGVNTVHGKGGN